MKLYGTYQASAKGYGFFLPEEAVGRTDDWFVPPHRDGGAWNGDRVEVSPLEEGIGAQRHTASVTAVVERTNRIVTGTLEKRGREVWLVPSSDRLPNAIRVVGRTKEAHTGDKAAVAVTSYGSRKAAPMGTLKEVFGPAGTRTSAVSAILYRYDIAPDFPHAVLAAADEAPVQVEPQALAGRLDLRKDCIITIDGASAKDLDDAVSLARDPAGHLVLGVHIADVSHYVPQGAVLDLEAWERGTSVYYADQVVPMLPAALSNGICSLNPQVDRLALSCIMTLDEGGRVVEHTIQKSVICTTERMTYDDCNALLEGGNPDLNARYAHILPMLQDMAALAGRLEMTRRLRGALALESRESVILCDRTGCPVDIIVRESGVSERLIESFMLLANETVARHLMEAKLPGIYRVHEKPSEDKANTLRAMLSPLGFDLREADSFALQKVLDSAAGTPQATAIHTMVLRSLMKARYDTENLGHFGLAASDYCHFTSPIRRYPDLMVHRVLTQSIDRRLERASKMTALAQRAAVQSSERENAAMSAEREIEKCYLAEFMKDRVGETFSGTVSGVTKFGLFVLLDNGVEGLLPTAVLPADHYVYDQVRMTLTGESSGRVYTFGMPMEVTLFAADPGTGQIDFRLPSGPLPAVRPEPVRRSGPPKRSGRRRAMHVPKPKKGRGKP